MWVSPSPSPAQLQPPSPVLGASGALSGRARTGLHCGRSIESPASSDRLPHCCCCCWWWWWCTNTGEYWHLSPPVTHSFCQTPHQQGDVTPPIIRAEDDEEPDITCDDTMTRGRGRGTQAGQAGSCSLGLGQGKAERRSRAHCQDSGRWH